MGTLLFPLQMWGVIINGNYLVVRLRRQCAGHQPEANMVLRNYNKASLLGPQDIALGDFSISQSTPIWIFVDVTFN